MQKRRGFTLIELLVVIAIIAILAAILFPVYTQVREHAKQTTCQANLKQIAMAVIQYCGDHDGYGPVMLWDDANQSYIGGLMQLGPYDAPYWQGISERAGTYQVNPLFLCKAGRRTSTYSLPWYGGGQGYWNPPGYWNIDKVANYLNSYSGVHYTAQDAMMVAESMGDPQTWSQQNCYYGHYYMFLTPKADGKNPVDFAPGLMGHKGGNMMAFRDGHVKLMSQTDIFGGYQDWWVSTE